VIMFEVMMMMSWMNLKKPMFTRTFLLRHLSNQANKFIFIMGVALREFKIKIN